MRRLTKDKACYSMSASNKPVMEVHAGEFFCVETEDCYSGNLRSPEDRFTKDMWSTVNPATGPIRIAGAKAGQILRVDIVGIKTASTAVMCVEHGSGALGELIEGVETSILPIRKRRLVFSRSISIPLQPMVGVIGTAPKGKPIPTGSPGEHGGNMDCKLITAGAAVYLPVNVDGAMLALGDLHAVMGDGEVCICAAEVSGEVTIKVSLSKIKVPTPCVETKDHFHFIASAATLDECERLVLRKAHLFLTAGHRMKPNDAVRAMSLAGDLGVCQVVDPLKTMRFSVPKALLNG